MAWVWDNRNSVGQEALEKVQECGKKRFQGKSNTIYQRKVGPKGTQVHAGRSWSARKLGDPRREKRGRDPSASLKTERNRLREGGRVAGVAGHLGSIAPGWAATKGTRAAGGARASGAGGGTAAETA